MIVVFSHAHPSVSKGGAEVSAYALYLGLRRLGQKAAFVAMCSEADAHRVRLETPDEHIVTYLPEHYDHFFHHAHPNVFEAARKTLEALKPTQLVFHHFMFLGINSIRRLLDEFPCPSALVLHEFLAICHHHGQMVTNPHQRLCTRSSPTLCAACFPAHPADEFNVRRSAFLNVLQSVDRLISPSHFLASRFIDWGVEPAKISVIENGLAGHEHAPGASAVQPVAMPVSRQPGGRVVFGYFGQINPFKGVDQILDAVEHVHEALPEGVSIVVRVHGNIVLGTDPAFIERFKKASQPGGLVQYVGAYQNEDVTRLMKACDFVLMASKWWENSPVVIQEAFAAQRPVIAPNIGGMAEKITDRVSGRHFMPNDPADLARLLLECAAEAHSPGAAFSFPEPSTAVEMAEH
jgi:glycosyltransferase involved in cell wall biosynthesis